MKSNRKKIVDGEIKINQIRKLSHILIIIEIKRIS
jgi:hypothetical protein